MMEEARSEVDASKAANASSSGTTVAIESRSPPGDEELKPLVSPSGVKPAAAVDNSVGNASKLDMASLRRIFSIRTNQLIFSQALPGVATGGPRTWAWAGLYHRGTDKFVFGLVPPPFPRPFVRGAGTIPWGVILVFLNDYLSQARQRRHAAWLGGSGVTTVVWRRRPRQLLSGLFTSTPGVSLLCLYQDKGFTVKQATFVVLIFGIGCAIGGLVGGVLGQKAYNRDPRLLPLFIGVCQIIAVLPLRGLINQDNMTADASSHYRFYVHTIAFTAGTPACVCVVGCRVWGQPVAPLDLSCLV